MQAQNSDRGRIFRIAAVFLSTGVWIGCSDPARPLESASTSELPAALLSACAIADIPGQSLASRGYQEPLALQLSIGDTTRLRRLWDSPADVTSAASSSWNVDDVDVARMEDDLVIPMSPGRTRLMGRVAGRVACVVLTAVYSGVLPSSLTVDRPNTALPAGDRADTRVTATLRYSNGLAVPLRAGASWTSLDPHVAEVSPLAFVSPRAAGAARIVASVGRIADTAVVLVAEPAYDTLRVGRAEDFVSSIGVNVHLSYLDLVYGSGFRSIIIPRVRELGVRHVRDGGTTLPNEDWMVEVYGRWRELADSTGARFTIIMSPRRSANAPGTDYGDMSHVLELRTRIGASRIAAWEGLNEHDLSGRPNFASEVRTLQQALYRVVKQDPQLSATTPVLGPTLANVGQATAVGDLSAFMDQGAIHPYDGGQVPTTNLAAHAVGIRPITGSRPLVVTEMGYHTSPISTNPWHWSLNENAQAKYTLRSFLELWNAGVVRSFAYELIDEGLDPSDMEHNFGLVRNDGSRKPAFTALRNLIALLGDSAAGAFTPQPLLARISGDTSGVRTLVVEKRNGRRYLLLWQNAASFDKVRRADIAVPLRMVAVEFPARLSSVSTYLPLTSATPTATQRGVRRLHVHVPDHPVVLELVR
jgi:hypothetical protein